MANVINADGISVDSQADLVAQFTAALQLIYGADINLGQSTPDGQWMLIIIQMVLDLQDLIVNVNNQFDPDFAIGVILDQRVAINGIQRQGGTFTTTNVSVVTSQAVTLYGLDQNTNPLFTVQDNAGNKWDLITSINLPSPGTNALLFQSQVPGAVLTVPNTITIPVTIVLGVVSINNPTTYNSLGINQESDVELRVRRAKSVSLSSQGYLAGLLAALENISGVTSAFVYENTTGSTDGDSIPSHSIWVIVAGTGAAASIANAIYTKRNAGCGMKGTQTFTVNQADGSTFVVKWDDVEDEDLFIKFTATSLDGVNPPNIALIRDTLPTTFIPGVNQQVNVNALACAVQDTDPNTLVTSAGFSTASGGSYTSTLSPSAKNKQFRVSSADIIILPLILNPASPDPVVHGATLQFSALGGFGAYVYTISVNNSSGSIDAGTGLYTAGATHPVTDTVRVTDALGNFTNVNVGVT